MADVLVARQPILDHGQSVAGYELLYRHAAVDYALVVDDELATARVALTALTELGFDRLVGDCCAWINITPAFVAAELAYALPPDRVVLELPAESPIGQPLLDGLDRLREAGYRIALDRYDRCPEREPLLARADIAKLDLRALGRERLGELAAELRSRGVTVVAQKIETHAEFRYALETGCDLVQGYFFCRPELVVDRLIVPNKLALLNLASAVQDPNVEVAQLDWLISSDIALSYRLLRYINSAYYSLRDPVSSIRQAVALLGIDNVRRWVSLTLFAQIGDKPRELFLTALIRARFCQETGNEDDGPSGQRFALGLFSVVDALTDTPMPTIVRQLPFPQEMSDALVKHTGAGRLLDCLDAIEQGDFAHANLLIAHSAERYVDSITWTSETAKHLFAASD